MSNTLISDTIADVRERKRVPFHKVLAMLNSPDFLTDEEVDMLHEAKADLEREFEILDAAAYLKKTLSDDEEDENV